VEPNLPEAAPAGAPPAPVAILLATLNAKYIHASFGLRCLYANLGELQPRAAIAEFDLTTRPTEIAEAILARNPTIVGLGIYIWNIRESTDLVAILKRLRPELRVVLGGPEVSHETSRQRIIELADHVIAGEADLTFASWCRDALAGKPTAEKVTHAPLPSLEQVILPYAFYTDDDLAHRILYVEASRGCPFSCEFCLSSLDVPVRAFPLEPFLAAMQTLYARGARHFKFVDRTFNLDICTSRAILEFFLERITPGLFLHFELVPDRLPPELREVLVRFPPGTLQFEIGIQTFNEAVADRISRRQHLLRLEDNLRFLRQQTGVHIHADLIAGLPGEGMESFAAGFDRLVGLGPQEIQVGILKRLRGAPIARHDQEWGMVYGEHPPYEVLQTSDLPFEELQRVRRFARYWDLVANSGNFLETTPLLWDGSRSPFYAFLEWSEWLHDRLGRRHGIALPQLLEQLFQFLTHVRGAPPEQVASCLWNDYRRAGRSDRPACLRRFLPDTNPGHSPNRNRAGLRRQARHRPSAPA
jgi:radical SAM superfamily enzyme YgiQ (UPF0313 family)